MLHLCFNFNVQDVGKAKRPREEKEKARSHGVDTRARRPAEEDAGVAEMKKVIANINAQDKGKRKGKARREGSKRAEQGKEKSTGAKARETS